MKEYTLAAFAAVALSILADNVAGTRLLRRPRFYAFLSVILFFKFLVNGFLTGAPVVVYNPDFFLGIRIGTIPVEDFLFGFSMVMAAVIVWEKMKGQDRRAKGKGDVARI